MGIFQSRSEKDLKALQKNLETKGLGFLITMMNCQDDYSKHIKRKDGYFSSSSSDSVFWYAYRKADTLNDKAQASELINLLGDPSYTDKRDHIYYCLGHLCKNLHDQELFNDLMTLLDSDSDKTAASAMLPGLIRFKKNENCNIEPIKKLADNGNDSERHQATLALCNSKHPGLEDFLLDLFQTGDKDFKETVSIPLRDCATEKSKVPLMLEYKRTRSAGLKMMIQEVLDNIEKE